MSSGVEAYLLGAITGNGAAFWSHEHSRPTNQTPLNSRYSQKGCIRVECNGKTNSPEAFSIGLRGRKNRGKYSPATSGKSHLAPNRVNVRAPRLAATLKADEDGWYMSPADQTGIQATSAGAAEPSFWLLVLNVDLG